MTHDISDSMAIMVSIAALVAGLAFIVLRYRVSTPINFTVAMLSTTVVAVVSGAAVDANEAGIRTAVAGLFLFGSVLAVGACA